MQPSPSPLAHFGHSPSFSSLQPLPQWHPQIAPRHQAKFRHLVHHISSTIILPQPIPLRTLQLLLHNLDHLDPNLNPEPYYTRLHHLPPTPQSLVNGLGPTGAVLIPIQIWSNIHLPLNLPPHPTTPLTRSTQASLPDVSEFLQRLQLHQLIKLVPFPCPAAPAFTTYKSEIKLRFIINLRHYNNLFPAPPPFSLPRFEQILSLPTFNQLWFVKIDIQNCFWSLLLPHEVKGQFYGYLRPFTFSTRRLPFGWTYSPILAHATIAHYLQPIFRLTSHYWQYLDATSGAYRPPLPNLLGGLHCPCINPSRLYPKPV